MYIYCIHLLFFGIIMGTRSDFCCIINVPTDSIDQFKTFLKHYTVITLSTKCNFNVLENFYITDTNNNEQVQFCLFLESIKFDYLEAVVNNFLDMIDETELNITFEAKELCMECVDFSSDFNRTSEDFDDTQLYIACAIDGIPDTTDVSMHTWLNTN